MSTGGEASATGSAKAPLGLPPRSSTPAQPQVSAETVVAKRAGDVLIKHSLLKSDHFPGCQNKKLVPLLDGAPNFRQVPDLPVYGVAIPTVDGLRRVLDQLGAQNGQRQVLWQNMREEPVLYINGRPYVVREADKPFANLEYTGIDCSRVEDMEARLKRDVLAEAAQYGNQIMVAHEGDDFQVLEEWEAVTEVDVQTPREVYKELAEDGYDVDYLRVPVTDEKAPKEADFAVLVQRLWDPPPGAALVFNCQMGRGRTTTGMVIASLLQLRRRLAQPDSDGCAMPRRDQLPHWYMDTSGEAPMSPTASGRSPGPSKEAELKAGRYGVVRSLLRVLERGARGKALLDTVIDACSAMQNLREAIASYRNRLTHEGNDVKRNALLQVCLEYLERYYVLIAFAAYMLDPRFDPVSPNQPSFGQWLQQRPELQSVLTRMLRRNPLAALALHRPSRALSAQLSLSPAASLQHLPDAAKQTTAAHGQGEELDEEEAAENNTAALVATRTGDVLMAHSILKEDHFPGCQSDQIPALLPGAPNFRGVPGYNVYGSGLPTLEGIKQVLAYVGAAPGTKSSTGKEVRAVWHNMREEPNVYINGRPYVLREDERPYKNMQEYTGIEAGRLERMEERLAADVVREAQAFGGRLLVAREATSSSADNSGEASSHLVDDFEPVPGADSVLTPRQAYEALQAQGYRVDYFRVPITDGMAPEERDFDEFYANAKAAGPADPLIFNCQMGGGRTTTGVVIGCLSRIFAHNGGQLIEAPPSQGEEADLLDAMSPRSHMSDELAGQSPRGSTSDDEDNADKDADDAAPPGTASTAGEDMEAVSLKEGEYVGVRRFTRILERGADAKATLDTVIDRAGALVNLRTAIMRYRRPRNRFRFYRPEIQARHTAFNRGSAYLERYCLLIAFTAFRQRMVTTGLDMNFEEWMSARPDVGQARAAIQENPAGALAPVPLMPAPPPPRPMQRKNSKDMAADEQKRVLAKRRGSTLSKRTILKACQAHGEQNILEVQGVHDLRGARGVKVYTVGSCGVRGCRALLARLGARPRGPAHVVVSDLREELVVYVNGRPYLRRELEMPSAALHHAGIQAMKLEELERRLRGDVAAEAASCGGRIMLHKEFRLPSATPPSPAAVVNGSGGAVGEDITRKTEDAEADMVVAPFWESTGEIGDIDVGISTPLELFTGLASEGYQVSYRRIPLSRERTPEAADLDVLHYQLLQQPAGREVIHLIVARTASGSSARFAAAFATCYLHWQRDTFVSPAQPQPLQLPAAALGPAASAPAPGTAASEVGTSSQPQSPPHKRHRICDAATMDDMKSVLERSAAMLGEYRNIMNLCRVLPHGTDAKLAVDEAVDRCHPIGNLRDDILKCKEAAEGGAGAPPTPFTKMSGQSATVAARRLGLHYLQRYYFLICFRAFLKTAAAKETSFARWFADRPELKYLLSTLTLEVVV